MRKILNLLVLLGVALAMPAGAADEALGATVDSLLAYARQHSPELAASRYETDAANERVAPAGALPDPTLRMELQNFTNIGSDASPNVLPGRVGSTKYTVIQPLLLWGKRDLKQALAQAEADQARGRQSATWIELSARIKQTFAQLYLAVRQEALARENLDLASGIAQITRARYAAGRVPQQDAIRSQVELTAMKVELLGLQTERHHMHTQVNALLGRAPDAPLTPPQVLRPLPPAEKLLSARLEQQIQADNPLLHIEEARIAAADRSRELTYRNRYPDIALGLSPIQAGNRVGMWEAMVELNIPLQQQSRRAQEREAEANLSAAQSRRDNARLQLSLALSANLSELALSRELAHLARSSLLPQAQANFEAALAGYESGRVDFTTLLDAQRQIRKAKQDELRALVTAQARLADIERLVGQDL